MNLEQKLKSLVGEEDWPLFKELIRSVLEEQPDLGIVKASTIALELLADAISAEANGLEGIATSIKRDNDISDLLS